MPVAEAEAEVVAQVMELQRTAVVELIAAVVRNADIVGQEGDLTVYLLHLDAPSAITLAALRADITEGGAELDEGLEFGEFTSDAGEFDDVPEGDEFEE